MTDNLYPYRLAFLKQQASDAWNHFQKLGYPHSKDENWRFSNINDWLLDDTPIIKTKENFPINTFSKYSLIYPS